MTARTKSVLLLGGTLALGMVLGGLLTGAIVNQRLERFLELRTGPGLAFFVEDVIQPTSEEQRRQIRAVLDGAAPRFAEVMRRSRQEMRALSDSVLSELDPLLTEEQAQRLRQHLTLRGERSPFGPQRMFGPRRGGRPPPGSGPDGPPPG